MFPCLIKGPENNCQEQTHNEPKFENYISKWINFANYFGLLKKLFVLKIQLTYLPSGLFKSIQLIFWEHFQLLVGTLLYEMPSNPKGNTLS